MKRFFVALNVNVFLASVIQAQNGKNISDRWLSEHYTKR